MTKVCRRPTWEVPDLVMGEQVSVTLREARVLSSLYLRDEFMEVLSAEQELAASFG